MFQILKLILFIKINKCDLSDNEAILLRSTQVIDKIVCQQNLNFWFLFCFFKQANRWQCCLSFLLIDVSENKNKWSHGCLGYLFTLQMIIFFSLWIFFLKIRWRIAHSVLCWLQWLILISEGLSQWAPFFLLWCLAESHSVNCLLKCLSLIE